MYIPISLPLLFLHCVSTALSLRSIVFISPMLLFFLLSSSCSSEKNGAPISLTQTPFSTVGPFFRHRFDFLNSGFKTTGQSIFQFRLFSKTVVAISGESGRKAFLTAKGFDLHSGFEALLGGIPIVKGITTDLHGRTISAIYRRLAAVQTQERLTNAIPRLLNDCAKVMESWGRSATLDPFSKVYELIFQLSVRSLASDDISDDPVAVRRLRHLYDMVDAGNTPAAILFPWLPTWGMLKKMFATWRIYTMINNAITARMKSRKPREDTLQLFLDNGDGNTLAVGFTMGLLIAGARATGTTASWLIAFLGGYPQWRNKAATEIRSLMLLHSSLPEDTSLKSLSASLSQIPLQGWESSTPVLDMIINETVRLAQPHTAVRRNVGPETHIDGKMIPSGAYVIYPFSDVHLNSELYPEPWKFDPNRPHHKKQFSWVGFGGGKNMCLGQRLAKLEMKLVAAMFVLGCNFSVVDSKGRAPDVFPRPNWNDALTCRPPKGACLLDYQLL